MLTALWVLAMVPPAVTQDEAGTVARGYFIKPKAGMERQYEAAYKKHIAWHRQQKDAWEWHTWQIETGERLGQYLTATIGHHWEDFDNRAEFNAADDAHFFEDAGQYVESATGLIATYLPEFSRPPEDEGPSPLHGLYAFHLNIGADDEFIHAIGKVHSAIEKTNWPMRHLWFALVSGGEHPTFYLVLPEENWAGFGEPETPFHAMLEEAYGRQEAEALLEVLRETIHCERSEIRRYRPDLSYVPAGD